MKNLIRTTINKIGFDIIRYKPERLAPFRTQRLLAQYEIDLILDVGANIGQYAKLVRRSGYSGRIVSFEPLSNAHMQLLRAKNDDPLWIVAPRTAVGDADGEIRINIAGNSFSSSVLDMLDTHTKAAPDSAYIGSEMVQLSRLDSIAAPYIENAVHNIFLKIDVQGFEVQVLEGAQEILPKVRGIQLELSFVPLYRGQPLFKEILDKMDCLGFDLYDISPAFIDENRVRLLQVDGTFIRRESVQNTTKHIQCA